MSVYDPVTALCKLGHSTLAECLYYGTEVTVHVREGGRDGGSYCVYKPRLVVNVDEAGKILLGDPMGYQLKLDPAEVRVSSGVSQSPRDPSVAWQRQRETL